jgi:cation:H+ antiporter
VSALITPLVVAPEMLRNDLWWMLGLTLLLFPIMRSRFLVTRVEGGMLLVAYLVYVSLLVINR